MVESGLPGGAENAPWNRAVETKWPLIRYAGSAAETSIGSQPIGSELVGDDEAKQALSSITKIQSDNYRL